MSHTAVFLFFMSWPLSIVVSYFAVRLMLKWLDKG